MKSGRQSPQEVDASEMVCEPLWNNLKHERGPFDVVADAMHGCFDELAELLTQFEYSFEKDSADSLAYSVRPPEGRRFAPPDSAAFSVKP